MTTQQLKALHDEIHKAWIAGWMESWSSLELGMNGDLTATHCAAHGAKPERMAEIEAMMRRHGFEEVAVDEPDGYVLGMWRIEEPGSLKK